MLSSVSKECSGPAEEEELGAEVWAVEGSSWHCSFVGQVFGQRAAQAGSGLAVFIS